MDCVFHLPEFVENIEIYTKLLYVMQEYPEVCIIPNTKIGSVFGNFRNCIWNGGTYGFGMSCTKEEVEHIIHVYNDILNLPLCFTFTNPLLTETDCYDRYGNMIAECGHNGKNKIRVSSNILEQYLRKKYPNYEYCGSVLSTEDKPYADLNQFNSTVIARRYNNNWEYLDTIPRENRSKIEFICDEPCQENCPYMYEHYRIYAQKTLEFSVNKEEMKCKNTCFEKQLFPKHFASKLPSYINPKIIQDEYLPRGFNQFKLTGRWDKSGAISSIITYLIKPEYLDDVIYFVLFR